MKCYRNKKFNQLTFGAKAVKRVTFMDEVINGGSRPRGQDDASRNVQTQRRLLPIFPARNRLLQEIDRHPTVIVLGETGTGKTTQIPQYLYESRRYQYGSVAITQPRRIAAITVAKRVAFEMGVSLGNVVGYCVRFDDVTSPATKLKYMTDGMLLREALLDQLLFKYAVIVLDEAHERTVQTDVLFGIVKKAQSERLRKAIQPLKIIIMSATMDVDHFSTYFNNAPVLYLEGRQHPVQIMYATESQSDYIIATLVTVFQIHKNEPLPGDILVFLTGQEEIEGVTKTMKQIAHLKYDDIPPFSIIPLFASLPAAQQLLPFQPTAAGVRRIIVSTNIAETSITLTGIKYVVDSGYVKARTFSPATGLDMLKVQKISKAQSWQRAGRAGRESSGTCYRLYTETQFENFPDNPVPEIKRCSLASVVLHLLVLGVDDIFQFDFVDKPSMESVNSAVEQLQMLGALEMVDDRIKLTDVGNQMSIFPVDPKLAKIILASKDFGCSDEIVTIVAMMSVDSVMFTPAAKKDQAIAARRKFVTEEGDLMMMLKIFHAYKRVNGAKQWCQEHFLHGRHLKMADDIRKQLTDMCANCGIPCQSSISDLPVVRRCLTQGLFMNAAELRPSQDYLTLSKRQTVFIHPSSCLFTTKPSLIVYSELIHTAKTYMRGICVVEKDWLLEASPSYFKHKIITSNQTQITK